MLLLTNEWFCRVWIVQEAALARDLEFHHGTESLAWERLHRACQLLRSWYLHFDLSWRLFGLPVETARESERGLTNVFQISKQGISIGDLVSLTARFMASNPLDKVYALLGITTADARSRIPVDYSVLESDLLSSTRHIIFEEHYRANEGVPRTLRGLPPSQLLSAVDASSRVSRSTRSSMERKSRLYQSRCLPQEGP